MKTYNISITGIGDQIQNRMSREIMLEFKEIDTDKREEWEEKNFMKKLNTRVINGKECVIQPEDALHKLFINACKKYKKPVPKEIGKTWTNYMTSSIIISEPAIINYKEIIPFGKMVNGCPSGNRKSSKVYKVRPLIKGWKTEITLIDTNEMLNTNLIMDFAELAGKYIGLSDWRPLYGRFIVNKVTEVK